MVEAAGKQLAQQLRICVFEMPLSELGKALDKPFRCPLISILG
jgi:ribosomal protein L30E